MIPYVITETDDYYPISEFLAENDVEVKVSETPAAETLRMWRVEEPKTRKIMAAVILQIRDGVYCVGGIAVGEKYRSYGLGKVLLELVMNGAREEGAKYLWASAKAPGYYKKNGWETMNWETSPRVAIHCPSCSRRGRTCFPEIMRIKL